MMKNRISRLTALMCMAFAAILNVAALDLPVKRVNGKQYYYHKVKKGESLYGIAKNIGLGVDEIIQHNPSAADGVKKGDLLVFPFEQYSASAVQTAPAAPVPEQEEIETERRHNASIAVMLPFGTGKAAPERLNTLALDFYKGMLIGADSLSRRAGHHIDIIARDTEGLTADGLRRLVLEDSLLAHASVIIGPEDDSSLRAIADAARQNGTYVFCTLNIRDSSYVSNPWLVQANLPQRRMYELAYEGLKSRYDGYRPVILRSESGRNEKEAFTQYVTERYVAEGIEPIVIEYRNALALSDLEQLGSSDKYVFIPSSGTLTEFNKFAYVVKAYRDKLSEEASAEAGAEIFGYPDWTAFRGDALETLHRMNATVYSRFFDDFQGFSATNIDSDFRRWFGTGFIESIPSYALLGYDSACYLIKNLRTNDGEYKPESTISFTGIQSTFDFVRSGEGYVNNALYIINYQPGGRMSAFVQ